MKMYLTTCVNRDDVDKAYVSVQYGQSSEVIHTEHSRWVTEDLKCKKGESTDAQA